MFIFIGAFLLLAFFIIIYVYIRRVVWSALISLFAVAMILMGALPFTFEEVKDSSRTELQAMGNSQGMNGNYSGFLFYSHGSVNDTQIVQYVVKHKNGYSQLKKVDAKKARVYEDEAKSPYLVRHTKETIVPDWTGFGFIYREKPTMVRMDFHVPKGSVSQGYSIDVSGK